MDLDSGGLPMMGKTACCSGEALLHYRAGVGTLLQMRMRLEDPFQHVDTTPSFDSYLFSLMSQMAGSEVHRDLSSPDQQTAQAPITYSDTFL